MRLHPDRAIEFLQPGPWHRQTTAHRGDDGLLRRSTARLPPTLPAGTHRLVVRAVTEYGDTVTGTMALEIV